MKKLIATLSLVLVAATLSAIDVVRKDIKADGLSQTGKGVVVGVIDAGFDYRHPAFRSADGSMLRISRVWEQSTQPIGSIQSPDGFSYGAELLTAEQILEAQGDISNNSHGSHVAAIIAGADPVEDGRFRGLAPDAEIVLVSKGDYQRYNQNLLDAINYIADYAASQGKACVINMSLGNQAGPHDGTSPFDLALKDFQREGLVLVGSVGNHHKEDFHLGKTFSSDKDAPLQTCIEYRTTPSATNAQGDIEIWGRPDADFKVNLQCINVKTGAVQETLTVFGGRGTENDATDTAAEGTASFSFASNLKGDVLVASEINSANGCEHVMISSRLTNVRVNYALALQIVPLSAGEVNVWADNTYLGLSGKDIAGYSNADHNLTLCEIGGTSNDIISVGAYTTRTSFTLYGETQERTVEGETVGQLSSFSSVGPTADGRVKPEITAPGCLTLSAVSSHDQSGTVLAGWSYLYDDMTVRYGYMQGTSMATPVVSGVVALMLQENPNLTTADAKRILVATAHESIAKIDAQRAVAMAQEATGIDTIQPTLNDTPRYNLQGMRVGAGYRGIVLQHGKKYVNR